MTSKKDLVIAVLALSVVGAGIVAWGQYSRAQELLAAQLAQARLADSRYDELQKKLSDAERRVLDLESAGLEREAPAAVAAVTEGGPAAAGPNGPRPGNGPRFAERRGGFEEMLLNNPEALALLTTQQKANLDERYSELFKDLKLSPADLEKFKNLLVEKQNAMRDVRAAAREQGLNGRENRDQIKALVDQANSELDASILATLGADKYNQYKSYEQTQPQRNFVSKIDQRLGYTSAPLSDTQSDQLVQIFAQASQANATTTNNGGGQRFGGGNRITITDATISQAQGVLSSSQVAVLKQMQTEQQAQQQLRDMMRAQAQAQQQARAAANGGTATVSTTTKAPAATP